MDISLKIESASIDKLMEVVSKGCGSFFMPYHMQRIAKAEVAVKKIKAKGEQEFLLDDFQFKLNNPRETFIDNRKYENISAIVNMAKTELNNVSQVDNSPVNDDWVIEYFNKCQDIGNKEMQSLWARILANEIKKQGSFSLRTLQAVKNLSREEAMLFTTMSSFVIHNNEAKENWFIVDEKTIQYLESINIDDKIIRKLRNSGLLASALCLVAYDYDKKLSFNYFENDYNFIYKNNKLANSYFFEPYCLTDIGDELLPICGAEKNVKYIETLIEDLEKIGFEKEK